MPPPSGPGKSKRGGKSASAATNEGGGAPPPSRRRRGGGGGKRSKDRDRRKENNATTITTRTKIVIRKLPPDIPEEIVWKSMDGLLPNDSFDWKQFHQGKIRTGVNKENLASRAYIHFKTQEQLVQFYQAYDGHIFKDSKGNTSRALVEFAPYQKYPAAAGKADATIGTIEEDPEYVMFMESLSKDSEPIQVNDGGSAPVGATLITSTVPGAALESKQVVVKSTPLLDHLRAQKAAIKKEKKAARDRKKANKGPTFTKPVKIAKRETSTEDATSTNKNTPLGPKSSSSSSKVADDALRDTDVKNTKGIIPIGPTALTPKSSGASSSSFKGKKPDKGEKGSGGKKQQPKDKDKDKDGKDKEKDKKPKNKPPPKGPKGGKQGKANDTNTTEQDNKQSIPIGPKNSGSGPPSRRKDRGPSEKRGGGGGGGGGSGAPKNRQVSSASSKPSESKGQ